MSGNPELMQTARELGLSNSYKPGSTVELPGLTGDLYIDAIQQSGISAADINIFSQQLGLRLEVVCNQLLKISDSLGGGLDPAGKKVWIEGLLQNGQSLAEIESIADSYKSSVAT